MSAETKNRGNAEAAARQLGLKPSAVWDGDGLRFKALTF